MSVSLLFPKLFHDFNVAFFLPFRFKGVLSDATSSCACLLHSRRSLFIWFVHFNFGFLEQLKDTAAAMAIAIIIIIIIIMRIIIVMMSVRCGDSNLFIVWLTIYWYGSKSIGPSVRLHHLAAN